MLQMTLSAVSAEFIKIEDFIKIAEESDDQTFIIYREASAKKLGLS